MQLDMHYHGTYAVARMAGFSPDLANTIATAAQYVDESVCAQPVDIANRRYMLPVVSAHKMLEVSKNFDRMDQWNVWVPFHFLPGGMGDNVESRMICLKGDEGNRAVEAIIEHTLAANAANEPYALHLLGIISHVIQDTYSHYGFSGTASPLNEVDQTTLEALNADVLDSYVSRKLDLFKERVAASFAEASMLGHAGAATFPDRPYMRWQFEYSNSGHPEVEYLASERDNAQSFYEACTRLHAVYKAFLSSQSSLDAPHEPFSERQEPILKEILAYEGIKEERCKVWKMRIEDGSLFSNVASSDVDRNFSPSGWGIRAVMDNPLASSTDSFQFHRAARSYLKLVHDKILPMLKILN